MTTNICKKMCNKNCEKYKTYWKHDKYFKVEKFLQKLEKVFDNLFFMWKIKIKKDILSSVINS